MNFVTLFQNKKEKIIIIGAMILILIVVGLIWKFKAGDSQNSSEDFADVSAMGQTAKLGSLEISFYDFKEGDYETSKVDENLQRIREKYLAAQIKVFNPSSDQTENILIILMDDQGNEYKINHSVPLYVADLKNFGRNMAIYPRIMQDGFVFFTEISDQAKKFELIFTGVESGEKIAFKIER